jgi:hypothetical protein
MGDVYRNAKITISAISSPGTEFGMLHDREVSPLSCRLDWISTDDEESTKVYLRSGSDLGDVNMKSSPLNTRGWALQEALLSPRTLSYATQQMTWECQECRIDEGGRPVAPAQKYREKKFMQDLISAKASSKKQAILRRAAAVSNLKYLNPWTSKFHKPYDRWYAIVGEYTTRSLTVATDVLPALSGLARAFQNLLCDRYSAGLWANDILRGLTWTRLVRLGSEVTSKLPQQLKPYDYGVPSWSWASTLGWEVIFHYPSTDEYNFIEEQAKVLEVITSPHSDDAFGQTKGGYLLIQSSFYDVQDPRIGVIEDTSTSTPILQSALHTQFTKLSHGEAEFQQQHQEHEGQKFGLLLLAKYFNWEGHRTRTRKDPTEWNKWPSFIALIVETTGMVDNEYRRVGIIYEMASAGDVPGEANTAPLVEEMRKAGAKKRKIRLV